MRSPQRYHFTRGNSTVHLAALVHDARLQTKQCNFTSYTKSFISAYISYPIHYALGVNHEILLYCRFPEELHNALTGYNTLLSYSGNSLLAVCVCELKKKKRSGDHTQIWVCNKEGLIENTIMHPAPTSSSSHYISQDSTDPAKMADFLPRSAKVQPISTHSHLGVFPKERSV